MEKRNRCRLDAFRRVQKFLDEPATNPVMRRHSLGWILLEHRCDGATSVMPFRARLGARFGQNRLTVVIRHVRGPTQQDGVAITVRLAEKVFLGDRGVLL